MITLSLSYDPQTKIERFTHGFAPVMRLSSNPSVCNYESHLDALERAVAGDLDCFESDDDDASFRAEQVRELAEMRSMTPAQWRDMEAAKSYRQQWHRYHASKLNPALCYTFPVCLHLQSVPSRS
jgi:hypothetical protein